MALMLINVGTPKNKTSLGAQEAVGSSQSIQRVIYFAVQHEANRARTKTQPFDQDQGG
jgi:hypothetical protein